MIEYPKKVSEAEIQAELWYKLREAGIDARLEVKGERSRLDIVIFRNKEARAIIECKSWSVRYVKNQGYQKHKNTKQLTKYRETFKVPVFVCGCLASIKPAITFASKCCASF